MVDINSPSQPLTIHLPADLIAQLQLLAQNKHLPVDEVVREACLAYTEPYTWERCYKEWLQTHPDQPGEFDVNGDDLTPPASDGKRA